MTDDPHGTAREAARLHGAVALDHLADGHDLPVSNGWTIYGGKAVVWCGQCRHLYQADTAWAVRFLSSRWRALRRAAESPRTRTTMEAAGRKVRELRDALRSAGVDVTWPTP